MPCAPCVGLQRAYRVLHEGRVEDDFPDVTVRVLEVSSVAAPERCLSWFDDLCARLGRLVHDFINFRN